MRPKVLLAGGGTGGHIFPNVAVYERLRDTWDVTFMVSERASDEETATAEELSFVRSPVHPLPSRKKPWKTASFAWRWLRAVRDAKALLRGAGVHAVVASGGFVSGPAMVAAHKCGVPSLLLNLDAVPGVANRRLAPLATHVMTVHPHASLSGATIIGLPLRAAAVGCEDARAARQALGLDPERPLLFVTGATHGATSIIEAMALLCQQTPDVLANWQVLHQCGGYDVATLQRMYDAAGVRAHVVASLSAIGRAWRAADVAIARAGAGTVAEVWANATPTIFLPNPYHHDAHQRKNAEPLVACGGARIVADTTVASTTLAALLPALRVLMDDAALRQRMRRALEQTYPGDGADAIAAWVKRYA